MHGLQSVAGKRVVLSYSGGLDTTCILFWLKEQQCEVICYTADVGQKEDFAQLKKQALELGASKAIVDNLQDDFVHNYIYPSLAYGGIYQGRYLLGTSLARPCIAQGIVKVAIKENAQYICHGATGKGNDQVRFELSCASLAPNIKCVAPWRLPEFYERFQGRSDLIKYALNNGFSVKSTPAKPFSTDANIMHVSYESGILEDPNLAYTEDMFEMTRNIKQWPDEPEDIKIHFKEGVPVKVENMATKEVIGDAVGILKYLNSVGGNHGVGRIDIVEDRYIGMKSRGVYESPGATIVFAAVRDLETLCLDREVNNVRAELAGKFAQYVYNGHWFAPECEYVTECLKLSQKLVSGHVTVRLYKGSVHIRGRLAQKSLYDQELVSMDCQGDFTPEHAEGFIRTTAVRLAAFRKVHAENPYKH